VYGLCCGWEDLNDHTALRRERELASAPTLSRFENAALLQRVVLAYILMVQLRRHALQGTQLARACTQTIRTGLLKIGAAIIRNTRRVRVLLASNHPLKAVFLIATQRLGP